MGKSRLHRGFFYDALEELKTSFKDPMSVFKKALENVKPALEVRSRRWWVERLIRYLWISGLKGQMALAMRWLVQFARSRNEKTMSKRLAGELKDAYNNRGSCFKKA